MRGTANERETPWWALCQWVGLGPEHSSATTVKRQRKHPRCREMAARSKELKPSDRMEDGTVYAGISPDTGRPVHDTFRRAVQHIVGVGREKLGFTFARAQQYAARLDAHGHQDWRVP